MTHFCCPGSRGRGSSALLRPARLHHESGQPGSFPEPNTGQEDEVQGRAWAVTHPQLVAQRKFRCSFQKKERWERGPHPTRPCGRHLVTHGPRSRHCMCFGLSDSCAASERNCGSHQFPARQPKWLLTGSCSVFLALLAGEDLVKSSFPSVLCVPNSLML